MLPVLKMKRNDNVGLISTNLGSRGATRGGQPSGEVKGRGEGSLRRGHNILGLAVGVFQDTNNIPELVGINSIVLTA